MKKVMAGIFLIGFFLMAGFVFAESFRDIGKRLNKMKLELNLTDQQMADLRGIMEEKIGQRMDLRNNSQDGVSEALIKNKLARINHEEAEAITTVLTSKQLKIRGNIEKAAQEKEDRVKANSSS